MVIWGYHHNSVGSPRKSAEKSGAGAVSGPNSGIVHDDPDSARRLSIGREDCRVDAFRQLVYDIELVDPIPWSPGPTSGHAAAH